MLPPIGNIQTELLQSYRQRAELAQQTLEPLQMLTAYQREHITRLETENRNQAYEIRKAHEMINQLSDEPKPIEGQPMGPTLEPITETDTRFVALNSDYQAALDEAIAQADEGFLPLGQSSDAFDESSQPA
jgi:hypothetical protein